MGPCINVYLWTATDVFHLLWSFIVDQLPCFLTHKYEYKLIVHPGKREITFPRDGGLYITFRLESIVSFIGFTVVVFFHTKKANIGFMCCSYIFESTFPYENIFVNSGSKFKLIYVLTLDTTKSFNM